jgi:L-cysteine/cystine lyase
MSYFRPLLDQAEQLRAACAAVLGCKPEELALTGSTTDGVNTVISGLDLGPGDEIVTSDEEHPGLLAPLGRARERCGVSVRVVPFAELPEAVSVNTRLIACSHVSWIGGRISDAAALTATGVPLLLDAAQALGAIPLDVRKLGCDFYAGSG